MEPFRKTIISVDNIETAHYQRRQSIRLYCSEEFVKSLNNKAREAWIADIIPSLIAKNNITKEMIEDIEVVFEHSDEIYTETVKAAIQRGMDIPPPITEPHWLLTIYFYRKVEPFSVKEYKESVVV